MPFDGADFYVCGDNEVLKHTDPMEAINEFLEKAEWLASHTDDSRKIPATATVDVVAYRLRTLTPAVISDHIQESLEELLSAYVEPTGVDDDIPPADQRVLHSINMLAEVVHKTFKPWACEVCGRRTYVIGNPRDPRTWKPA